LNSGLEITLVDERTDAESQRFHYPGGLNDYVGHINRTKEPLHPTVIGFSGRGTGYEVEIALQWNTGYAESVHTFANTINTPEGGVHEEGFRAALTAVVNRYARSLKV
ncbi:DNA topoisomerase IV subunit B, partial [Streptomyces sp. SID10244]|nr:DNA topoisomerase IV subunit B [Streptomyces sp. SID10244]